MNQLVQISSNLKHTHENGESWRKAAEPYGINAATARLIANGREPGKKIRKVLGLPDIGNVICVDGSSVPDGTQIGGVRLCLGCGAPFSIGGNRKYCFRCRPIKRRRGAS